MTNERLNEIREYAAKCRERGDHGMAMIIEDCLTEIDYLLTDNARLRLVNQPINDARAANAMDRMDRLYDP